MIAVTPLPADIIVESATATAATLVTVPAGRWFCADITLSATAALAGTANPTVTWTPNSTGCGPATTKVVARCVATGLLAAASSNSTLTSAVFFGGDTGGVLSYTAAGAGSSTCAINGFLI